MSLEGKEVRVTSGTDEENKRIKRRNAKKIKWYNIADSLVLN